MTKIKLADLATVTLYEVWKADLNSLYNETPNAPVLEQGMITDLGKAEALVRELSTNDMAAWIIHAVTKQPIHIAPPQPLKTSMMSQMQRRGDRVVIYYKPDQDEASYYHDKSLPPAGRFGTIVGFSRYKEYRGHDREYNGVWERNGAPIVLWDGETTAKVCPSNNLYMLDQQAYEERYHTQWGVYVIGSGWDMSKADLFFDEAVRLGDLPETKFMGGDTIDSAVLRATVAEEYRENMVFKIMSVEYGRTYDHHPGQTLYNVEAYYEGQRHYHTSAWDEDMTLIKRGPVWCELHDEPYIFTSAVEQAAHEVYMRRGRDIRNPNCNNRYQWTLLEALTAIRNGEADTLRLNNGWFGSGQYNSVQRYDNRTLGEALRAETIQGFADMTDEEAIAKDHQKVKDDKHKKVSDDIDKRHADLRAEWAEMCKQRGYTPELKDLINL